MLKKSVIIPVILILWFLIHIIIISVDGMKDEVAESDVAVVFGNMVQKNGQPSMRLKGRLDAAYELYKKNYFNRIIVSGGIDPDGNNEAEIMKKYLIGRGLPESSIITDSNGVDTHSTAVNTAKIMEENKFKSAFIISQFYHISRTKLAFNKAGIKNVSSAHADYFELRDIYSLFREFFAYYKYLIL